MKKFFVDEDAKQINMFDERWYELQTKEGLIYVPSVTTYLEAFPKGFGYADWLKNVGKNAEEIMTEAGQKGSATHGLIEQVLLGNKPKWIEHQIDIQVWENFLCWCKWFKEFTAENEVTWEKHNVEQIVYNIEHKSAGTIDFAPLVNGKRVVFDWKTSKAMYESYELQVAAYAKMYEAQFEEEVKSANVLLVGNHLNKAGWRLHDFNRKDIDAAFEDYQHCQKMWLRANKNPKPKFKQYPMEVDLEFIKNNEIITMKGN